jgi:hypothetical protein
MRDLGENWPKTRKAPHGGNGLVCECRRCRIRRGALVERLADQSLSAALRHAQDDPWEAAWTTETDSPTLLPSLGPIRWSAPVSLRDLNTRTPASRAFFEKGKLRLYRICRRGAPRPLYVGMVHGAGQSVARRIQDHLNPNKVGRSPRSATRALLVELMRDTPAAELNRLMIRFAEPPVPAGFRNNPQFLHAVELLAQQALDAKHRNMGDVVTFEDEEDGRAGPEAGEWRNRLRKAARSAGLLLALTGGIVPGPAGKAVRDVGRAVAMIGGARPDERKHPTDQPPRRDTGGAGPPP